MLRHIPEANTWTQHCIHAQAAYIPEANKWTQMYNKKLIVKNLDYKYHYTYKNFAAKSILSQITKKLDSHNRQV